MSLLLWKDMEGIFFGQLVWTSCSSRSSCRSLVAGNGHAKVPRGGCYQLPLVGPCWQRSLWKWDVSFGRRNDCRAHRSGLEAFKTSCDVPKNWCRVKPLIELITVTLRRHGLKSCFKRNELGLFIVVFCSRTNINPWVVPYTA